MSEFYYPLECGWDIVPSARALVSNTPPQAGRVLRTTRVLYRYSAFVGGSMHPYAHDTVKTLAGKRYIMRPRYGPIPANSICCVVIFVAKLWVSCTHELPLMARHQCLAAKWPIYSLPTLRSPGTWVQQADCRRCLRGVWSVLGCKLRLFTLHMQATLCPQPYP